MNFTGNVHRHDVLYLWRRRRRITIFEAAHLVLFYVLYCFIWFFSSFMSFFVSLSSPPFLPLMSKPLLAPNYNNYNICIITIGSCAQLRKDEMKLRKMKKKIKRITLMWFICSAETRHMLWDNQPILLVIILD